MFDDRFVVVLKYPYDEKHHERMTWVDKNSAFGVSIQIHPPEDEFNRTWYVPAGILRRTVYIGFENTDDALFFKIKYSI